MWSNVLKCCFSYVNSKRSTPCVLACFCLCVTYGGEVLGWYQLFPTWKYHWTWFKPGWTCWGFWAGIWWDSNTLVPHLAWAVECPTCHWKCLQARTPSSRVMGAPQMDRLDQGEPWRAAGEAVASLCVRVFSRGAELLNCLTFCSAVNSHSTP